MFTIFSFFKAIKRIFAKSQYVVFCNPYIQKATFQPNQLLEWYASLL